MDFNERSESGIFGKRMEFFQLLVGQDGDNEEDGVRAPFDGFEYLAFINDEIFAEQREFDGFADLAEVIERALEEFFVSQHGEAACTGSFVFLGDADGVEVFANDAGGRGSLFDFGNEADVFGLFESSDKIAALAMLEEGVTQVAGGDDARGELRALAFLFFDDIIENVHSANINRRDAEAQSYL